MAYESSSRPIPTTGLQTLATNKRLRTDSDELSEIHSQRIHQRNKTPDFNFRSQQMTSSNRNKFPPITLEFTDIHDKSDRKLIEELIKEWKCKNTNDINILGRFRVPKRSTYFCARLINR